MYKSELLSKVYKFVMLPTTIFFKKTQIPAKFGGLASGLEGVSREWSENEVIIG